MNAIPIESEQRERLYVKLRRELGREVLEALESPGTEDILLNPDASLWVKSTGRAAQRIGVLGASQAASAIGVPLEYDCIKAILHPPTTCSRIPF